MELPDQFKQQMARLLGQDYERFIESYNEERHYGLRLNLLKSNAETYKLLPFIKKPVPWCKTGYYYDGEARPAKDPLYTAGCFYIQEPSAMTPGEAMDVQPGDWVIDLCGAPGGKTTHMASAMAGEGLIVANDISASRAKSMFRNVQMAGVKNSIVIGEDPAVLAERWQACFDRVLVDAPCSGEGMFRKEPKLVQSWVASGPETFVPIQRQILSSAYKLLKVGGYIVYSTCTYNKDENEGNIQWFIENHSNCEVVPIADKLGISQGFELEGDASYKGCGRVWPHRHQGEGHFIACIKKTGSPEPIRLQHLKPSITKEALEQVQDFCRSIGLKDNIVKNDYLNQVKDRVYLLPGKTPETKGLRVLGSGWFIGTVKKHGLEPSQAFASGLMREDLTQKVDFSYDAEEVRRYLKGESIQVGIKTKGWHLVTVNGCGLGWAKVNNGRLKNKLEPSWRWM